VSNEKKVKGKSKSGEVDDKVCLVHAKFKKKTKLSTSVAFRDHVRFQMHLATLLKAEMDSLQKPTKKKQHDAPASTGRKATWESQ